MRSLYFGLHSSDMKKHPNSPHLSIKRLQALAEKWAKDKKQPAQFYMVAVDFINYVSASRPSLKKLQDNKR